MGSPAYDDWVAEARAVPIERALGPAAAGLKRSGRELVGPCPVCGGRDRFGVNLAKGVFVCRGSGTAGDSIALVRYLEGCDFDRAVAVLAGRPPPGSEPESGAERAVRLAARVSRRQQAEAAAAARAARDERYKLAERERAHNVWSAGVPIAGTLAVAYLQHRGLVPPPGARLRFAPRLAYWLQRGDRKPVSIWEGPALLAAVIGEDGFFRGVHMTWLDPALAGGLPPEASGKVALVHRETGEVLPARKVRGTARGTHIELVRAATPRRLVLGEGIETTLSVWRALVERRPALAQDCAAWAGISLGNMAGAALGSRPHPTLRRHGAAGRDLGPAMVAGPEPDPASAVLAIPASVETLVLLGDGDSEPVMTGYALERCARRHATRPDGRPREVTIVPAPPGLDWNDVLRSEAA